MVCAFDIVHSSYFRSRENKLEFPRGVCSLASQTIPFGAARKEVIPYYLILSQIVSLIQCSQKFRFSGISAVILILDIVLTSHIVFVEVERVILVSSQSSLVVTVVYDADVVEDYRIGYPDGIGGSSL